MTVHTATAFINHNALLNNLATIKHFAPQSKIVAVLKANAYGHGLERIAEMLDQSSDVSAFGVARLDEALALKAAGITKSIVLLEGFFSADELITLAEQGLETIVHNEQQLQALCSATLCKPVKAWLKIDSGMHRLGVSPEQFSIFYQALQACENVANEITLISHLSSADDLNSPRTQQQVQLMESLTQGLKQPVSLANSAGICAWPSSHFDLIRPGIMLYGVSPMMKQSALALNLTPVMTLKSSLIALRQLPCGESVGYGASWTATQDTTIGVIAVGYGDGYPRHAKSGTSVLINGRKVPLVGRVSMDMITVDLGPNAQDTIGDIATLWGDGLAIEDIAYSADTIAYELLCNITRRVNVVVITDESVLTK